MNFLDRAILALAPKAGLKRLRSRAAADVLMSYDATTTGRRGSTLRASQASADAAAFKQRNRLRGVARDLVRNRPLAARAVQVISGNVVGGAGILPSIQSDDPATRQWISDALWRHFSTTAIDSYGELTLSAMQTQICNSLVTDGEVLIRRRYRQPPYNAGLPIPLQLQVMEADHLHTGITSNGNNDVVEGIEYGPTGKIEAYHLYRDHPGDTYRRQRLIVDRVPASEIIHVRRMDRPAQLRGVSWFAPVVLSMADLSDYHEAQIVKQKMAGFMVGVLRRSSKSESGNPMEELGPGAILEIEDDDELTWSNPPTVDGYNDFVKAHARYIAAALGITYESLTGDLEGVSFISGRMGRMEMERNIQTWQQQIIIAQFCNRLAQWIDPLLPAMAPRALAPWWWEWTAPRRPMMDPAREVPAAVLAVESGLTSMQRQQREIGLDPEAIRQERAEDAAAGASVVTDPPEQPQTEMRRRTADAIERARADQ